MFKRPKIWGETLVWEISGWDLKMFAQMGVFPNPQGKLVMDFRFVSGYSA